MAFPSHIEPFELNAVVTQPESLGGIREVPRSLVPECPPGLEPLLATDQVMLKQKVNVGESIVGFEGKNKFKVVDQKGKEIFKAKEESGCCTRWCCKGMRGFIMHVTDTNKAEVMRAIKPFRACANKDCPTCPCTTHEIRIEAPVGTPVGHVAQGCSCCRPTFRVKDENRKQFLSISGPCCMCYCCRATFTLLTPKGKAIGKVAKHWGGVLKERFSDADNYGVKYPLDLDVKAKATLMGAVFLINMLYFNRDKH